MINTEDNQNQPNKDETQKQLSLIKYIFKTTNSFITNSR